ncbi:MAG: Fic family protein [Bacteroidetes bacterium]|nr:MAG: Fic family protein [Bacteroidota bacterium]
MSKELQREYPNLMFRRHWDLSAKSLLLLGQCEAYVKAINNTPILPHHYGQLMNVALMKGAQATTAIEGNTLSDEEVQKIMDNQKLPPSKEYQAIEVGNILTAFNELLSEIVNANVDHFISIDLLLRFHKMVGQNLGEHFAAIPGQLRNSDVIVGRYRCPDHRDVPILLEQLCEWLRKEFKYGQMEQSFSEVVIQAIVTHVYIEWIHPFGDGNGRTGRLVEFYILLRGGNPDIASHILSNYYNMTRTAYYLQIEKATENRNLSNFIEYALLGFRDGLEQTLDVIQKSQFQNTWQKLIYDKFDAIRQGSQDKVFRRQRTLALEIPFDKEFTISQVSNLSVPLAKQYSGAGVTEKTVQRDVEKLVELELVRKSGVGYIANTDILRSMIAKRRTPSNGS